MLGLQSKPKYAERTMTFFKVLYKYKLDDERGYVTPYFKMPITFGTLYEDPYQNCFTLKPATSGGLSSKAIYDGAYHLFRRLSDAKLEAFGLAETEYMTPVVVKAIVPQGTLYIDGWYSGFEGVCAKSVKYEEL